MTLLPLEVLPGWPQPEPVSAMVALTIIGPLAVALLITVLFFGPKLARDRRERELAESRGELETTRPDGSV
ncbi:MAG: hypothetical protein Q4F67_16095 [Propionibacteriaceae bacterium]|nr:hypothetical protein [Propionibacteriaceae bacterium]